MNTNSEKEAVRVSSPPDKVTYWEGWPSRVAYDGVNIDDSMETISLSLAPVARILNVYNHDNSQHMTESPRTGPRPSIPCPESCHTKIATELYYKEKDHQKSHKKQRRGSLARYCTLLGAAMRPSKLGDRNFHQIHCDHLILQSTVKVLTPLRLDDIAHCVTPHRRYSVQSVVGLRVSQCPVIRMRATDTKDLRPHS